MTKKINYYNSLSKKYKEQGKGLLSKEEVNAYVQARQPATYAAVFHVLQEVSKYLTNNTITSLVDWGAGPGTGSLAAKELFPQIENIYLIEENPEMIAKGKEAILGEWISGKMEQAKIAAHDLSLFAYSFGEIPEKDQIEVLDKAWQAAGLLILIEPGTPKGFRHILRARDRLISLGGNLVAPCPHSKQCPLDGKEPWCHFSVRLERSRIHRHLKGGSLGWEDEKFSYLCMSKMPLPHASSRLLAHPTKHSGHIRLKLCGADRLEEVTISKKEGELYTFAKKLNWGDPGPSISR